MSSSIYDFEIKNLSGRSVKLSDYKGKVLLIVNIASKCGNTPQLTGLEHLYEKYKDQGFEVLAFPSNDFMQEPKEGGDIQQFCSVNYGVQFRIFEKGKVRGSNAQPLYRFLAEKSKIGPLKNYPFWNFQKYIIDRNGNVADYFNPFKWPESAKITEVIEKCLHQKPVEN